MGVKGTYMKVVKKSVQYALKGKEQGQQDNFLKYFGKTGFNRYRTLFCKISWRVKSTEKTKEKVIRILAKSAPMRQKGKTDKKIPAGTTESSPVTINTGKSGQKDQNK